MSTYTPTQQAILKVLADGKPHKRGELIACLPDPLNRTPNNLKPHLAALRRLLRPQGGDIVCVLRYRQIHHQHVRRLLGPCNSP